MLGDGEHERPLAVGLSDFGRSTARAVERLSNCPSSFQALVRQDLHRFKPVLKMHRMGSADGCLEISVEGQTGHFGAVGAIRGWLRGPGRISDVDVARGDRSVEQRVTPLHSLIENADGGSPRIGCPQPTQEVLHPFCLIGRGQGGQERRGDMGPPQFSDVVKHGQCAR